MQGSHAQINNNCPAFLKCIYLYMYVNMLDYSQS